MNSTRVLPFVLLGLAIAWLAMLLGGTGPLDHQLLHALYAADCPAMRGGVIFVTNLGTWVVLVPLTMLGLLWLLYRCRARVALLLLAITLVGRALVELQKWSIHRPRPEDQVHLVPVNSLSFPSAHAANSMMLFLAIALIAVPPRWRGRATALALIGTATVGLTRPMLGVHWPSDVVGGWAFGAAWVLAMLGLAERTGQAQSAIDPRGRV